MEPNQYKVAKDVKAGSIPIANARSNKIKAIKNTCTITKKSMSEKKGIKTKPSPMKLHQYKAVIINSITLFIH